MAYWLMKSEPDVFGFDDLKKEPKRTACWDGVRNFQARNMLRDQMQVGDQAFFYHSNCAEPGIVGKMDIVRAGYPDPSQFDSSSKYYDPKSKPDAPRWYMVDVRYLQPLSRPLPLAELKTRSELEGLALVRRGNRLSVMPVSKAHWHFMLRLSQHPCQG